MTGVLDFIGRGLAAYLAQEVRVPDPVWTLDAAHLHTHLRPGDVLLVDGNTRLSSIIRAITHSSWSHAALYVGDALATRGLGAHTLVEADLREGVRGVPAAAYAGHHVRICRPIGLSSDECTAVMEHAIARIGDRYDLRNLFDLARYLLPWRPKPARFDRHLLKLGSGEPTRAICSTLIAQSFHAVGYPIVPGVSLRQDDDGHAHHVYRMRGDTLFVPADFDLSPYFEIVKPAGGSGFDFHRLRFEQQR